MDSATLVDEQVEAGEALVRELDRRKFEVDGALWLFVPDAGIYQLVIETPHVKRDGRTKTYSALREVLAEAKSTISPTNISVVGPEDPTIQNLTKAFETGQGISRIRVRNSLVHGEHIADALIYRLRAERAPTRGTRSRLRGRGRPAK